MNEKRFTEKEMGVWKGLERI